MHNAKTDLVYRSFIGFLHMDLENERSPPAAMRVGNLLVTTPGREGGGEGIMMVLKM